MNNHQLSIRRFAELNGTSHTTIRNLIKQIQGDLNITIGTRQGNGKPVLLSLDEQALLKERLSTPLSTSGVSIQEYTYTPQPIKQPVAMPDVQIFNVDTSALDLTTNQDLSVLGQCRAVLEKIVVADGLSQGARLAALHRQALMNGLAAGQVATVEMYQGVHAEQAKSA